MSADSPIVVVGRPEIAAPIRKRFAHRNVAVFRESEAIIAQQTVLARPPKVIALDPQFAGTSRGAALIAKVKADGNLALTEMRLLTIDNRKAFLKALGETDPSPEIAICSLSRELDWCGTRRAQRFAIASDAPAELDGQRVQLVNLSASGVQLVSSSRLRPSQRFRLTLGTEDQEMRLSAVVAWSRFEGLGPEATYRAGASFVDPDPSQIEEYCRRYGKCGDQVFVVPDRK